MKVRDFELINEEKVERALNGTQAGTRLVGGIGGGAYKEDGVWKNNGEELSDKQVEVLESSLLAEYDKLGGLITKDGDVVKMGCFYDFKAKKAIAQPTVVLVFNINGKKREVLADEPLPAIVRAAKEENSEAKGKKDKKTKKDAE